MTAGACPKRMVFGPCSGVHLDGSCEMQPTPCPFTDLVRWPNLPAQARAWPPVPLVVIDYTAPAFDAGALASTVAVLATSCDTVLVGEHQSRPDYPPTELARLLRQAGVNPWITLACRDRNRVVLEQELRGLHSLGVDTVLCVTGDGRGYDVRADVTQVFDLDGTRLAALAASLGVRAAVAETPTAPPTRLRPQRLVQKQHAGASVALLNHAGSPDQVAAFVRDARAAGLRIPVLAAVAVYTDPASAAALQGLPGLDLDLGAVETVLQSADPVATGVDVAVAEARALLAIEGVDGVNVSGRASSGGFLHAAEIKAEIGRRIRAEAA